jgi:hypothetical protein
MLQRLFELALADRFPGLITYEISVQPTLTFERSAVIYLESPEIFIKICSLLSQTQNCVW